MLRRTLMIGLLLAAAGSGAAEDRSAVFGLWATNDSILEIGETDGTLHATIVAMLNPLYNAGEEGAAGTPRVDREKPVAGTAHATDSRHEPAQRLPVQGRQMAGTDLRRPVG